MCDDLDELLDEVEQKFCSSSPPYKPVIKAERMRESSDASLSELDSVIKDICDDDPSVNQELLRGRSTYESCGSHHEGPAAQQRCFSVLLGGSNVAMGATVGSVQKACNRLRCLSCDFHIVWFDNYKWHSRSDYLFFRNNVPDFERLRKNLVRKNGCRAYACQCSWLSVEEVIEVSSTPKLRWVCGKH